MPRATRSAPPVAPYQDRTNAPPTRIEGPASSARAPTPLQRLAASPHSAALSEEHLEGLGARFQVRQETALRGGSS
eukprot:CAMPEP_0176135454 /NCGR_PEP_ID=MMETSP0120_2-20121206/68715_1 /TAXON_ID=160619 /ORGANISM="Kryptoperidinium foliaceum, Strain CCMP 1326" /LENGTH=75 /DNA_ID=CAMNT_0017471163 /DNA_START=1 /DNA_END=229 /DNA_ORIENTATION=+